MSLWVTITRNIWTFFREPFKHDRAWLPRWWVTFSCYALSARFSRVKFCTDSIPYKRLSDETKTRGPMCVHMQTKSHTHVKDVVVHAIGWIMETLHQPACTVGWVPQLCRSWLSPEKATRILHWSNANETTELSKKSVEGIFFFFNELFDLTLLSSWTPYPRGFISFGSWMASCLASWFDLMSVLFTLHVLLHT